MAVCLSYLHRHLGPLLQCTFPGNYLLEEEIRAITGLMDKVRTKDYFIFNEIGGDKTALNYFFEIPSPWSHQNAELLMLSIIPPEKTISNSREDILREKMKNFAKKLRGSADIFKGFYFHDRTHFQVLQRKQIITGNVNLQKFIAEFYNDLNIAGEIVSIKER